MTQRKFNKSNYLDTLTTCRYVLVSAYSYLEKQLVYPFFFSSLFCHLKNAPFSLRLHCSHTQNKETAG